MSWKTRRSAKWPCPKCGGPKCRVSLHCNKCAQRPTCLKGPRNPFWRGGRSIGAGGYVFLRADSHPWPRRGSRIREHVVVMELHLGRRLRPDEVVHHKDHNKLNNALANLELMSRAEHARQHGGENVRKRPTRLKPAEVLAIRERFRSGLSAKIIAAEFAIHRGTALLIGRGKRWAHVREAP